ncbi:MAG: Iron hydrogenase 1 [Betaproteobacteria bacterium ADurb.Bin341]|nr:MAG: Iron hydrogenase 1 [Betaproteobacteria bacterium ADurb.Bin341]
MEDDPKKKTDVPVSRRGFLKLAAGAGIAGGASSLSGCLVNEQKVGDSGWLPQQYRVPGNWPVQVRGRIPIDPANPAITRDDAKCVLCGQCQEVCEKIQTVHGHYELPVKDDFICIHCGQCSLWCPTAAITETFSIAKVDAALADPGKIVIVQTAPATRVALGEEFGMPVGSWVQGQQISALRKLGFARVFDTNFSADLTIVEEATELVARITGKGGKHPLPQLTSCCPGWVKFVEYFYPDLIPNLSTAKSPQQMMGALIKTYYAKTGNIDPEKIFSVSVMPCTGKKFEIDRPEYHAAARYWNRPHLRDMDAVLTTRELASMIKRANLNFPELPEGSYDPLLGASSGAGLIFGNSGGVMEAAVRSAYFYLTGNKAPPEAFEFKKVRGLEGVKEASLSIPGVGPLHVAVIHGLKNARVVMDKVRAGNSRYHFIEVMSCPGGCVSGGGQPRSSTPPGDEMRRMRTAAIYQRDAGQNLRESYKNPEIKQLYANFLGEPCGELAHKLLHTDYVSRADRLQPKKPQKT